MTSTIESLPCSANTNKAAPETENKPLPIAVADKQTDSFESLSLVLSAVGIEHWFNERTREVLVAEQDAEAAAFHLEAYRKENLNWPPPPPPPPTLHPQTPPTLLMMGLLALFFAQTGPWSAGSPWFDRGAIDSVVILDRGEWWRLVTALTLHADLVHLIGNCLVGGLMVHLLSKWLGYGLSWLLLILTGFAGNLLNVVLHGQPHISLGLSTSVFAAIGIFSGLQLSRPTTRHAKEMLLPLGAGFGLLGFLGSEGVRTDLGAHFFGFISGVCCGMLLSRGGILHKTRPPFLQAAFFLCAVAIILLCWLLALR